MSYGVLPTGFAKKLLLDIKADIEQAERDSLGSSLNLLATSVLGQLNGIMSERLAELWDVGEAIYRSLYPDSASGDALDNVAAITGALRLEATKSTVTLRLFLDDGVTVTVGSVASVGATGARFATLATVTNSLGYQATFTVAAESEDFGPVVGLSGTIDTIQTPVSGWSAATALTCANAETYTLSDGQTLTFKVDGGAVQTVTFNTVEFADIANATAAEVAVVINAESTGVTAADEGGYVRIVNDSDASGNSLEVTGGTGNAVLGFDTTLVKGFNALDAEPGTLTETDEDFRVRREGLLTAVGSATVDAIRADILRVEDVLQAFVFENETDVKVGDLEPHSFEAVVLGGDDQEIADAIWATKPAGIQTSYTPGQQVTKTVYDSQGLAHTINFTRPDDVEIYFDVTVAIDSTEFPADGDDQIKAAMVEYGDSLNIGDDVIALRFESIPLDIAGVIDVTVFELDTVTPPTGTTNISIGDRELAVFDTSRIRVYHA
jgi:uncharacterized phage protein gp47/JayE